MKTFPLYFEDAEHKKIKEAAEKEGKTIKDFIMAAIEDRIIRTNINNSK